MDNEAEVLKEIWSFKWWKPQAQMNIRADGLETKYRMPLCNKHSANNIY